MKSDEKTESTSETLNKLIDLIATRDDAQEARAVRTEEAQEKRAEKTDEKIDKLTESMTASNIANVEARKDNKEIFKTLKKQGEKLDKQGEKLATHSEALAVQEVKINSSKSTIRQAITAIIAIVIAVTIGKTT